MNTDSQNVKSDMTIDSRYCRGFLIGEKEKELILLYGLEVIQHQMLMDKNRTHLSFLKFVLTNRSIHEISSKLNIPKSVVKRVLNGKTIPENDRLYHKTVKMLLQEFNAFEICEDYHNDPCLNEGDVEYFEFLEQDRPNLIEMNHELSEIDHPFPSEYPIMYNPLESRGI